MDRAAYQRAFEDFSLKAQEVQRLTENSHADPAALDAALLQLERARITHNTCRDALAQQLGASSDVSETLQADAERVRSIAALRWEVAGRPEGTAEDDWYRAEKILRQATAA